MFSPMSFDPSNHFLKIRYSKFQSWSPLALLHFMSVNVILELHYQPTSFHALALVMSPRLGS